MAGEIPAQTAPSVIPELRPTPARTERASAESFGSRPAAAQYNVGQALEKGGNVAANSAIRFAQIQNETAVEAANTEYGNRRRDILFGNKDQPGFYQKKGKDAYDARVPTEGAIEDARKEVRDGLKNPQQQRMFDSYSRRATDFDLRSMAAHASQENQNYRLGVVDASIKNTLDDISSYWNDPVRFARGLGELKIQAENRASLTGRRDPEEIRADIEHYSTAAWTARIKATMGQSPLLAKRLFEANADQIHDPAVKAALTHELQVAALPEEARVVARRVMAGEQPNVGGATLIQTAASGAPPETRSGGPDGPSAPQNARDTKAQLADWLPAAERAAEKLYPGDEHFKEMVTAEIKGRVNTVVAMQDALSRQAHSSLIAASMKKDAGGQLPTTTDELLATPEARNAWALLKPEDQRGFLSANGVLAQNAKVNRGEMAHSDPRLVNSLTARAWLPDGDPNKITSPTQITQYLGHGLAHVDAEKVRKEIAAANNPEGNAFLKQVADVKARARRMLLASRSGTMHPDQAEEASYRFNEDLDRKIAEARTTKGADVQELFASGNSKYVLDLNRVAAFMPGAPAPKPAAAKPAGAPGAPKVEQKKPGESPADYLKRIGSAP